MEQTQDSPADLVYRLWPWLEANKNAIIGVVVAITLVTSIYYFITTQHDQKEIQAGQALTQLMLTATGTVGQSGDALTQLAAQYSGTEAAKRAELEGAASLFAAGRYPEAQAQFQKFIDGGAAGQFAATAELGVGASLEAQGNADGATTAYQRVLSSYPGTVCDVPAYSAMGRVAESQGKLTEALNYYSNAVRLGGQTGSIVEYAAERARSLKAQLDAAAKPTTQPAASQSPSLSPTLILPEK